MFRNKKILVTGGTGSWGNELVRQLLDKEPAEIRIFSRNEYSQVLMKQKFSEYSDSLKFIIGDIKEKDALNIATKDVDYVFHLAALKHVPVCEDQPLEALKTNVLGTQNVIDVSIQNNVEKVIYISTDKAADPANFYGCTKAMGEKLIIQANMLGSNTKFVCVRGGNVLGTNGSVIHVFKEQIKRGQINLTDKRMTRFFLTIQEAIKLLFKATEENRGGEIFVMKMPSCQILDLAEVLIEDSGAENVRIEESGIRPGEKIHELLFTNYESQNTVYYDHEYYAILPAISIKGLKEYYSSFKPVEMDNYNSSQSLMSREELKTLLQRGGFIS